MAVVLERECVCLCSQSGCYPMPLSLRSQLWLRVIEHSFDWKWSEHCVMSHLSTPCYPSLSGRWRGLTSRPAPWPLKELAIISALPLCTPQATMDNWVCVRNRCERPSCFFSHLEMQESKPSSFTHASVNRSYSYTERIRLSLHYSRYIWIGMHRYRNSGR